MFDHLTTPEVRAHVARLEAAMRRPTGMAYTLDEYGADARELKRLRDELRARNRVHNRNPAEMTGYASLYPGVDHHPNRSDDPRSQRQPQTDHFKACARCDQTVITRADVPMCEACQARDRAPQGEAVRLFAPAPTQLPGQLGLACSFAADAGLEPEPGEDFYGLS